MPSKKKRKGKTIGWLAQVRRQGVKKSRVCSTRQEALALEAKWREEIKLEAERTTPTILEWGNDYLDFSKKRHSERTYLDKQYALDLLVRAVGGTTEVRHITVGNALHILDDVAERRSGYVANQVRKNLLAAWNWGNRYLDKWPDKASPFGKVESYSYQKRPRVVPPMEDVQAVLSVMDESDRAMLLAYLHTAARRDEIFRLQWEDIDFANSKLTLWTRKRQGGAWEADRIPMTRDLREALLKERGKGNGHGLVFCREGGRKYQYRRHWIPYWCERAGVPKFSFHGIRHLAASWLDAHNVPLTTIQAVLRHKSANTTAKYLHELRGVQADLDSVFSNDQKAKVMDIKKASAIGNGGGLP